MLTKVNMSGGMTATSCSPCRSYMVVAPEKIHPDQVVQMSVSILNLYYKLINVRIIIRRYQEEIARALHTFHMPGTAMVQLKVVVMPTLTHNGLFIEHKFCPGQKNSIFNKSI